MKDCFYIQLDRHKIKKINLQKGYIPFYFSGDLKVNEARLHIKKYKTEIEFVLQLFGIKEILNPDYKKKESKK